MSFGRECAPLSADRFLPGPDALPDGLLGNGEKCSADGGEADSGASV